MIFVRRRNFQNSLVNISRAFLRGQQQRSGERRSPWSRWPDSAAVETLEDRSLLAVPTLAISNTSVTEGTGSTVNAVLTVSLSAPSSSQVRVNYATADGAAKAGSDYTTKTGTLTFAPGVTTQQVTVSVSEDALDEADEDFLVNLNTPVNATLLDGQASATILDNDATPTLSISDTSVTEGTCSTVNAVFTVRLSAASGRTVTVSYATANGYRATAPADYTAKSSVLTFAPGATTQTISIAVSGDTLDEPQETFLVNLSLPSNADILDGTGVVSWLGKWVSGPVDCVAVDPIAVRCSHRH